MVFLETTIFFPLCLRQKKKKNKNNRFFDPSKIRKNKISKILILILFHISINNRSEIEKIRIPRMARNGGRLVRCQVQAKADCSRKAPMFLAIDGGSIDTAVVAFLCYEE